MEIFNPAYRQVMECLRICGRENLIRTVKKSFRSELLKPESQLFNVRSMNSEEGLTDFTRINSGPMTSQEYGSCCKSPVRHDYRLSVPLNAKKAL